MSTTPPPEPEASATDRSVAADALIELALLSTRLHPDDLAKQVARIAARVGMLDVVIYLADIEQRVLVPLTNGDGDGPDPLAIDGTIAGRAYRTELPVVSPAADDRRSAWLPLLDSAERLGVVGFQVDGEIDDEQMATFEAVTHLAGEIIANKSDYGDLIARTRRTRPMSVTAELRWAMLPPLTYSNDSATISGIVEPAYEIAGDTFDYAVNGDTIHLAIIDAVGHGLEAARIANLAVITYRHSRRHDLDHGAAYRAMDTVIGSEFGHEKFATAQLASLTVTSGKLRWLNAGHPPPMVIRRGHRIDLSSEVTLPVGLGASLGMEEPEVAEELLEPGDFVLFFTDGVVEARSAAGEQFGRDRLADLLERAVAADQPPAETLRVLGHAVLDHQIGVLEDDSTLLVLVWHGPPGSN